MQTTVQERTAYTVKPLTEPSKTMRVVTWQAKEDVRVVECEKPLVMEPHDAVIKVTSTTICGSDLHLYHGSIPGMKAGDILGHECVGIVEEVGNSVKLKPGQHVVVSAVIADGKCDFCQKEMYSLCDASGHHTDRMLGYSHLAGSHPGGQAEYVRVPFADVNCLPLPDNLADDKVILLSDVLPTAWHANELGQVGKGKTVAIWGAGPIGLASAALAKYRGATRVIVIDSVEVRLHCARGLGCEIINFTNEDPVQTLLRLIPGGPSVCIDAVGFRFAKSWRHSIEQFFKMETDAIDSLSEAIYSAQKGGTIVLMGDYIGTSNHFPLGAIMEKGLTLTGGQVFVQKYWKKLLEIIESGEFDSSFLISAIMPLEKAPEAYRIFDQKRDEGLKIILKTRNEP